MQKTNAGLVAYAKAQLGKPYWYGTFGNTATRALLLYKKKQYPYYYDQSRYQVQFSDQLGQRVHDCVGLIKGYLWSESPTAAPVYNVKQDVSANELRLACAQRGGIGTMPDLPGVLVFFDGHVGVYIGGGEVIEARGHDYGVVRTKLKARPWTHWGKCPWIVYADPAQPPAPAACFQRYTGRSISIVDALEAIGQPSSYADRKRIAAANGVADYRGTAAQNLQLLAALKAGTLRKP
ncbi:MAG: C40 family peptidase [Clostridia bacterium]|nr:C40 family peptidase [Clostridia bacterium]